MTSSSLYACFFAGNPFSAEGPDAEDGFFIVEAFSHEKASTILEKHIQEKGRECLQPFGFRGPSFPFSQRGKSMEIIIYRVTLLKKLCAGKSEELIVGPIYHSDFLVLKGPTWTRDYSSAPWYKSTSSGR